MLGSLLILPLPAPPADGNLGLTPLAQVIQESVDERNGSTDTEGQTNANDISSSAPPSVATHTRTIGIIYPPPDIRNIVDKTSQFVAKNGPEFEKRIIANNEGNAKFNFLHASDPYYAYYLHRLSEARAQNQVSAQQQPSHDAPEPGATVPVADASDALTKTDPAAQYRPICKVLEPPEAEQYTVRLPEGLTGEELDLIKLTAQFVARNGKSFLTGLTSRESSNPQFHFLRPAHSMFMFFTSLADAYSKVLMPSKGLTDKLRRGVVDMTTVLERCLRRLEWERSQEQARQKAEDEIEQERLQMAMIDWHDFVVVETIDFSDDEDEDLPPPMTLEEVVRRSKMTTMEEEDIIELGNEVEMDMDEEEVQLVEDGMRAASLEENGGLKNNETVTTPEEPEPPLRIVRNWKRPEDRILIEKDSTKYVVSPITGELVLINEMSEHMRISLIDPKYKEQKDRMFAKIKETTLAADDEISRNIVGLARTRPDIFGTTEEEVSNAVKAEIENKNDEQPKLVIWDGHTGSIGHTTTQVMSHISGGEDLNETGNNDGWSLPGPAPPPMPGMPSVRPLPPHPGLVLNIPRPPTSTPYPMPTGTGLIAPPPPRPPVINILPPVRPLPPISMLPGQTLMASQPSLLPSMPVTSLNIPVPPPPGSQFMLLGGPRPLVHIPMPQPGMPMVPPPPMLPGMPPPPPPEEAPPPLPDEPEPKRQRLDDSILVPEDQFLVKHPGPAHISISVPSVDEANLKGQVLEITVQSISETVGSLKEKIAGDIQLPANKQKLSGKTGFLKDNLSLAYYNIGPGDSLSLSLRERGGRKR